MNAGTRGIVVIAALAVIIGSVAFSATFVSSQLTSKTSSTSSISSTPITNFSTTTSSIAGCAQSSSDHTSAANMATVYHVTSTVAVLCVTYEFVGAGVANFTSPNVQPWVQNGSEVDDLSCSSTNCNHLFNISSTPAWVDHGADTEVNVTYTIESRANATGLFIVFGVGCNPIYLAFGAVPSSVYLTAWTCGPSNVLTGGYRSDNYNVTGFTNIEPVSVPWT